MLRTTDASSSTRSVVADAARGSERARQSEELRGNDTDERLTTADTTRARTQRQAAAYGAMRGKDVAGKSNRSATAARAQPLRPKASQTATDVHARRRRVEKLRTRRATTTRRRAANRHRPRPSRTKPTEATRGRGPRTGNNTRTAVA